MVKKLEFIWNIISSIVSAILSAVLLMFCTRINGTEIAGVFSIAFATSSILNAIGDYGIRPYQVTDTNRKYKFSEYIALRIVVVAIMFIIGIVFVLIKGYETEKLIICLLLVLYRVVDNLSETYQGELQIQGRLDIASKSVVIRNLVAMFLFFVVDLITKNIIFATIAMFITNLLLFLVYDLNKIKPYSSEKPVFNFEVIKTLLKECLPVCISTLLSLYLTNVIKYAIDAKGTYEMQTYYNIIFLPTFTINLASIFVIKPMFKSMGEYWNNRKIKELNKNILITILIIAVTTLFVELVCALVGIQILQLIYGVELSIFKIDLLILVLSGCFYAISNLMLNVTTTIRRQKLATIVYFLVSVLAVFVSNYLVVNMQIRGASLANIVISILLAIMLSGIYVFEILKKKKEIN